MPQYPVILHLSDLHFGNSTRYKSPAAYQTFLKKTQEDLDSLKARGVKPNIITVTGDLTEKGQKDQFKLARKFLDGLTKHMHIPKENVILVPGNHDVNWDLCKGARLTAKGKGAKFEPPYFEKLGNFKDFFDEVFNGAHEFSPKLYQVYDLSQYGLLVAGFNSCVKESDQDHYGWIGLDQVNKVCLECDRIASASRLLRIAIMHHNFKRLSENDCENLRDASTIHPALEKGGFRLIMHGHRHYHDLIGYRNPVTRFENLFLSTGSAGLDRLPPEGIASQYQLIKIEPKIITLYMRQYSTVVINERGKGSWLADPSRAGDGIVKLPVDWLRDIKAFAVASKVPSRRKKIALPKTEIGIGIVVMGEVRQNLVQSVVQGLNDIQPSFKFELEDDRVDLGPFDSVGCYSYALLDQKTEQYSRTHKTSPYLIYILDKPMQNNWFGFWTTRKGIFTISDWKEYFTPPSVSEFIRYYIAHIILYFLTRLESHEETKSCLNDFCKIKTDIRLGMSSGQLCAECSTKVQAVINRKEMSSEQFQSIQRILQSVRNREG